MAIPTATGTENVVDRMLGGKGQAPGETGTGTAAGVAGGG